MTDTPWISRLSQSTIAPARAARALEVLSAAWPQELPGLEGVIAAFNDQGAAFGHLLAVSPISLEKILRDPKALLWLAQPEIHETARGPRRIRAMYDAEKPAEFDPAFRALRRVKARESLRIALREVAGWASMEQTTLELTLLAELCLKVVCDGWTADLVKRWGKPETEFAILGMGKFGGQELNYSSDIDVIFFYGEDGQLNPRFSYQEFFTRLAEKIIGTFTATDPAGALFRIDLRLRPEGASGPLVRSLDSMENYYSGYGETWERMALIKSRVVAGCEGAEELGYEFAHRLQPFIFPRAVPLEVVDEIRAIKERIEREIVGQEKMRRNVKLGYGGIREIEFVAQTLQILHASRHAFLQERGTLKTLTNLRQLGIIPHEEMETLIEAYRFLRTVEHRLQIEAEAQTHMLPERREDLALLAASLARSGLLKAKSEPGNASAPDTSNDDLCRLFTEELEKHTGIVRAVFDRVLGVRRKEEEEEKEADLGFFRQPQHARKVLVELELGSATGLASPRTRRLYARLEPLLLQQLQAVADPDAALNRFVRFVERYGIRGLLFETLIRSPRLLLLLVRLFDASEFMTEIALRRPQLIEEVARGGGLGQPLEVVDYLTGLAANEEGLAWQDWERAYLSAQILRIGLRDILGFAPPRQVQAEYSALAEACLVFAQRSLGLEDKLTVVAMGKFGGAELTYGADLDVIFFGENPADASALIRTMSARTGEGITFAVDARLRPEGEAGQLALPLDAYEAYFQKRAQIWEGQALTKARPISGPHKEQAGEVIRRIWSGFGRRADLTEQITAMHARIVHERAGAHDAVDFKAGAGGLIHAEFFVQARQMKAGIWEPNTFEALTRLGEAGALDAQSAEQLREDYGFLRSVEAVLRRMENTSVSRLPADEITQKQLALRCGLASREDLLERVQTARRRIAELARDF